MKPGTAFWAALVVVACGAGQPSAAAEEVGWMRPGVRLWYLGGVGGSGVTSSNAEEAYLITAISGNNARVVRHSALTHWTSPQPIDTSIQPTLGIASCWIHPTRLAALQMGDLWLGQEITLVVRASYTYANFLAALPAKVHFLPIKALFAVQPERQIVKIRYMLSGFSFGTAYFDADTGLMLYHDSLWGTNAMFFILAEINYDFATHTAFAEDDGPHTGYKSFVSEQSLGKNWVGGGSVVIQSLFESRHGHSAEMRVMTSYTPSSGGGMFDENYAFFGDVPLVTKIDATQAGNSLPEQWTPFGQFLWWWIPPNGTGGEAAAAGGPETAAPQDINVYNVPMTKTSDSPLTYAATQSPSAFHFETLWFDGSGYLTAFAAKGSGGLDLKPTDDYFQNLTSVDGRSYFRNTMRYHRPGADLNGDGMADIAVFRASAGSWWIYGQAGAVSFGQPGDIPVVGDYDGDGVADLSVYRPSTGEWIVKDQRTVVFGQAGDIPAPGDYDGLGRTEMAVFRPSTGQWIIEGRGAPTPWGMRGDVPAPADYDGDGLVEIAVFRPTTGVWYVMGGTTLTWGMWGDVPVPADYNGDGQAEIAVYRPSTGWWYVANGVWAPWGAPGDVPVPLDVDGDGASEFIVFRPGAGAWFSFDPVTSTTSSVAWGQVGDLAAGQPPRVPETTLKTAGDFDHDGSADLTVFRPSDGGWYTLKSTSAYREWDGVPLGQAGDVLAPGDYRGTGRQERAVYRPATGQWLLEDGRTFVPGAPGDVPVPADYDGDGTTDLAVFTPATATWTALMSKTAYADPQSMVWGVPGDTPAPGDYDGDGKADLGVFTPATGMWRVYNPDREVLVLSIAWGMGGDIPVPGDYDGDGVTDVAVYRPATGMWYVLTSSSGFASWAWHWWGAAEDVPVPGDFDGDGDTDVAVYRPSSGTWYVMNLLTIYGWGQAGDVPVLGRK